MNIVIIGGSNRLGLELSTHYLKKNNSVCATYYSNEKNLAKLKKNHPNLYVQSLDVTNKDSLKNFVSNIKSHFNKIDLLINLHGKYLEKELLKTNNDDIINIFQSNLIYVDFLIRNLQKNISNNGTIINFGYSHCDKLVADQTKTYYHIAKTSLLILTKSFAQCFANKNINVNMVSPGYMENSINLPEPTIIPQNRFGKASDIYNTIDFLTKKENKYFTGNNIIVSGAYNI